MKAIVNKDTCIGCGACTGVCPDVFTFDDEGKAEAGVVADGMEDSVQEAVASCPVGAIEAE